MALDPWIANSEDQYIDHHQPLKKCDIIRCIILSCWINVGANQARLPDMIRANIHTIKKQRGVGVGGVCCMTLTCTLALTRLDRFEGVFFFFSLSLSWAQRGVLYKAASTEKKSYYISHIQVWTQSDGQSSLWCRGVSEASPTFSKKSMIHAVVHVGFSLSLCACVCMCAPFSLRSYFLQSLYCAHFPINVPILIPSLSRFLHISQFFKYHLTLVGRGSPVLWTTCSNVWPCRCLGSSLYVSLHNSFHSVNDSHTEQMEMVTKEKFPFKITENKIFFSLATCACTVE